MNIRSRGVAGACAAALLIAACGGSSHAAQAKHAAAPAKRATAPRPPQACTTEALDVMARFLAVAPSAITTSTSIGNNAYPQCSYRVRSGHDASTMTIVNVDNGPQPYFILERTIVEASQVFGAQRLSPAPTTVPGLGLEASWFPAEQWLEATDGYRLITTSVDWRAPERRKIQLARAMTETFLHTPHGKVAQELANGYASSG